MPSRNFIQAIAENASSGDHLRKGKGAPAFTESEEEGTNPDRSSKAQRHVLGRNGGGQSSLLLVSRIQRGGGISSLVILSELK